ncbi:hypothetical protein MTO96_047777 [Rhipicephalus appendiculatus]
MSFFAMPNRSKAKNATQAAMQLSAPDLDPRVARGSVSSQTEQRATLPGNVIPVHYDLELNVSDIEAGGTYRGRVNVVIDCVAKGSTTVTAHAVNITVREANISTYSGNQKISNLVIHQRSSQPDLVDTVVFDLGFELVRGTVYNLSATFTGNYRADAGLIVRNYTGQGGKVTKLMTAHLWNEHARYAFPCFDDASLKATFNLSLVRDKDFEAVSTWELKNTTVMAGNRRMDIFEMSVPISPSQLVFGVFKGLDMINEGYSKLFAIRYDLPYLDMALKSFVKMFDYMGVLLKVPLPFRKVNIIAIPDAKESISPNWGLVILGAPTVAYDEESLNTQRRESILMKLAHVVAHQWFGNLVSSRQWDDVWLFEGLAFVFQRMMLRDVFQSKVSDSHFAKRVADVLRAEDMKKRLSRPPRWLPGICDHPLLLRSEMIMDVILQSLTTEEFVRSVAAFLHRTRYRAASVKDLLLAFRLENSSSDVADKMETWINNIGYPLVTVKKYAHRPGFKRLSQVSVCYGGVKCFNQSWQLPLHYVVYKRSGEITEGRLWLLQPELNFFINATADDIVLFNKQGLGYYRVSYEQDEWTSIIKALHNATLFDSGTKLRLLDDIFKLADAGVTPYSNFFAAASHVKNEKDQNVWAAYWDIASYLDSMLLQSEFPRFVARLQPQATRRHRGRHYERQEQPLSEGVSEAGHGTSLLRKTVIGAPLPDGKLLCAAILHGSAELWDMLWSKLFSAASLEHATFPLDAVLHGLSCTPDRHRLWKLLNETTGNNTASIDRNVRDALFRMVSRNAKTTHEVSLLTAALATTSNNRLLSEAFTLAVEQRKHYTSWHKDHDSEFVKAFAA